MAVLQGDPSKNGPYTVRIIFPANWSVAAHWHDEIEVITILRGILYVGKGKESIAQKAMPINEGGFGIMPAKVVHHASTENECIAQVHGIGPVKRYFK